MQPSEMDFRLLTDEHKDSVLSSLMSGMKERAEITQKGTERAILRQLKPLPITEEAEAQTDNDLDRII